MTDFNTMLAIIATAGTIIGVPIAFLTLRRTPKPKPEQPPFISTSTTILGASMNHHVPDLPSYSSPMRAMGFDRPED